MPAVVVPIVNESLHRACSLGDLAACANEITKEENSLGSFESEGCLEIEHGRSYLSQAVMGGHIDVVNVLLNKKCNLLSRDRTGGTALHTACFHGQLECAKLLLEAGADPNVVDDYGETPLHEACSQGHQKVAELLLACGANVFAKDKDGDTPLHRACDSENLDLVLAIMVRDPSSVLATNNDGWSPLHTCVDCGFVEGALEVCKAGANVYDMTVDGESVLDFVDRQVEDCGEEFFEEKREASTKPFGLTFREELEKLSSKVQRWNRRKGFVMMLSGSGLIESATNSYLIQRPVDDVLTPAEDVLRLCGREIASFL